MKNKKKVKNTKKKANKTKKISVYKCVYNTLDLDTIVKQC